MKRAVSLELVEDDGVLVTLRDDWSEWTGKIVEFTPTANTRDLKAVTNANETMAYCDSLLQATTDTDTREQLERRRGRAASKKARAFKRLTPDIPERELFEIAQTVTPVTNWYLVNKLEAMHANARIDLAESRRAEQWETTQNLLAACGQLHATDTPRREWFPKLRLAGYTESEAARGVKTFRAGQ